MTGDAKINLRNHQYKKVKDLSFFGFSSTTQMTLSLSCKLFRHQYGQGHTKNKTIKDMTNHHF